MVEGCEMISDTVETLTPFIDDSLELRELSHQSSRRLGISVKLQRFSVLAQWLLKGYKFSVEVGSLDTQ